MMEQGRLHLGQRGYSAVLVVVGLLYLLLEHNTTPTLLDDVVYRFQFTATGGLPPEPIQNLGDVLRSQYWHYLTINGRAPAHVLAQTFLMLGPGQVLNVLNALLFMLLIDGGVRLIAPPKQGRVACAALLGGTIFVLLRGFQGALLWQLGTLNYLWPIVLQLFFLLSLRKRLQQAPTLGSTIVLLPVALLAGWTHEALSLPVSLGLVTWLIVNGQGKQRQHLAPAIAAYIIGTTLCLASPGIWHRAGDAPTFASRLINGCVAIATNVRILWALMLTLLILWRQKRISKKLVLRYLPVAVMISAAYGIVFASGVTLDRVAFHAEMMTLLALLALWWQTVGMKAMRILGIVMTAVALTLYAPALAMCCQQVDNYRYAVAQMKQPGVSIIQTRDVRPANTLERITYERYVMPFADYGFFSCYMGFDAEDSNMRCAASLYGKSRLWFLPEDIVLKMKNNSLSSNKFTTDEGNRLYAIRIGKEQKVKGVEFLLKPEDPASLHFWQRPVAYKGDSYALDDFHWEVLQVAGRHYLVFTRPVTAISRRIDHIAIH